MEFVPAGVNEWVCAVPVTVIEGADTLPFGVKEWECPLSAMVIVGADTLPPAVALLMDKEGCVAPEAMPPSVFVEDVVCCVPPLLYVSAIVPAGVYEWEWLPTVTDVALSYVCVWALSVTAVPAAFAVTPDFVVPVETESYVIVAVPVEVVVWV